MPLSLHAITGMERIPWGYGVEKRAMRQTVTPHEIEKSSSILILSGVLERFPRLKIVSAENNCGWLPYYLRLMDRGFRRFGPSGYPYPMTDEAHHETQRILPAPKDVSEEEKWKIVRGKASKLYGFDMG